MSQYNDKSIFFNNCYLMEKDFEELTELLNDIFVKYKSVIYNLSKVCNEKYRVFEITDEIIFSIKNNGNSSTCICLGYPFPIYKIEKKPIKENFEISLHLRGDVLRKRMKQYLCDELGKIYSDIEFKKLQNVSELKSIAALCFKELESSDLLYLDPNSFIGDSIIELKWIEILKSNYNIENVNIISNSNLHINMYYNSVSYSEESKITNLLEDTDVICIPDLLDFNINNTLEFIRRHHPMKPILVVGKNLIIYPGRKTVVYYLDNPDILMTNQGMHNYIIDCIEPFIKSKYKEKYLIDKPCFKSTCNSEKYIFINIFSSMFKKDLDLDFVKSFIETVMKHSNYKIIISKGLRSKLHNEATNNIYDFCFHKHFLDRVEFMDDKSLSDLNLKLFKKSVVASITADTSISHMLTKNDKINFTFYYYSLWDNMAIQSIAGESPISYCSKKCNQIPIVYFEDMSYEKLGSAILRVINCMDNGEIDRKDIQEIDFEGDFFKNAVLYDNFSRMIPDNLVDDLNYMYDVYRICYPFINLKNNDYVINEAFNISALRKILIM